MSRRLNNTLITALKLLMATTIIYYMVATGSLDLNKITELMQKKLLIGKAIVALLVAYALITLRWYYLLIWQGIPVSLKKVIRIACIGFFFNSFMLGTIGGDLVKAFYVTKETERHRSKAVVSILVDRVIGLVALMLLAFIALLINYKTMLDNPVLMTLGILIGCILFCCFAIAAAAFSKPLKKILLTHRIRKLMSRLPKKDMFIRVYEAFHIYACQKWRLAKGILLSLLSNVIVIYIFFTLGRGMGETELSLISYCTIVPVGLIVMVLPIAPAGIGIGQAVFYNLFNWFGATSGLIGTTIITMYQLIMIMVNVCFVFVYIANKSDIKQATVQVQID